LLFRGQGCSTILQLFVGTFGEMTVAELLGVSFHQLANRDICLITVEPSDHPVFVKRRNQAALFWLRAGSGTRKLPVNEAVAYRLRPTPLGFLATTDSKP